MESLTNQESDEGVSSKPSYTSDFMQELSTILSESSYEVSCTTLVARDEDKECAFYLPAKPKVTEVVCHLCSQICSGQKGLRQHLAKSHSSIPRTAACPTCGKYFKHRNAAKFHHRQVHEKTTRVSCPVCFRLIYNKYMLKKHLSTHFPAS